MRRFLYISVASFALLSNAKATEPSPSPPSHLSLTELVYRANKA